MATILLAAAGAAAGAGLGGTLLGLSGAVIGRTIGATIGQLLDQRLLGQGSAAVEVGRIDRFRLTGASEGAAIGRVWGRLRLPGHVIWASRFEETATRSGGKGAPVPKTTQYSYSISLAVALCEGEITRIGRIWADGTEVAPEKLNMRVYSGSQSQLCDPKIEAVEGDGMAPAYRGIAYVVFEDLALAEFGNRVPQFSFEVVRPAQGGLIETVPDLTRGVRAVAMIPGTGEYALATTRVHFDRGLGECVSANVHGPGGETDFSASLTRLTEELPNCKSVSLVVSWFGADLRAGNCRLRPKVEQRDHDGVGMPWVVSGLARASADTVPRIEDRPVYGGTPADASVIEAIAALKAAGKKVVFYPFILMDQLSGNGLDDPWGGAEQAKLPWRGRITLSVAPGREGSPDGSVAADAEVAEFFGAAAASDFSTSTGAVLYSGPDEWSLRRFILHYAALCQLAGGVDAFCIGSELVSLTRIRGAGSAFPAVEELRALAGEARAVLGPACKIGYAADWSEYFGFQPGDGDVYFHLDPLWADSNIDFVGIDNYMPLADWRDGEAHADAKWGSIYNLDYLKANIAGGEGFEWYYAAPEHRLAQLRTPITDGAYDEPWVWRYKDLRGWWQNSHHERIGGTRQSTPTAWVPGSKPIWFTELGCAAVDKGANQPNKFLDPKSSESSLPHFSDGRRDELMQMQYLRAMSDYWSDPENNPVAEAYSGRMVDNERAHVWAWDARPFPLFPAETKIWSDGANYARGHWISGRVTAQPLANVVAEICDAQGARDIDVSALYGAVRGYSVGGAESGRAALQPLMLAFGFEAVERDGKIVFRTRSGAVDGRLESASFALGEGPRLQLARASNAETAGRIRLNYVEAEGDYEVRAVEAIFPDEVSGAATQSEISLALTRSEGRRTVERWLAEARIARDTARFALPISRSDIGAGDVVEIATETASGRFRIDRVEQAEALEIEATRVERAVYSPSDEAESDAGARAFISPVPVFPIFLDLPLLIGSEIAHSPHLAVAARPWPGSVALYSAIEDDDYALNRTFETAATIGQTLGPMFSARAGVPDLGSPLRLRLTGGALESVSRLRLLDGANLMAIGDGSAENWEVFQFSKAEIVEPGIWEISERLRGQVGTDAIIPAVWPTGSTVVLLNGAAGQIDLPLGARGLARHYRIGSAALGYDDPSYVHRIEAFEGVGLRPYSPCHLRVTRLGDDLQVTWVRRTRIDGDSWAGVEVPLGEASESYLVRVIEASEIRREDVTDAPAWLYSAAMRAADGISGAFEVEIAQLSDAFGAGLFARIEIDG